MFEVDRGRVFTLEIKDDGGLIFCFVFDRFFGIDFFVRYSCIGCADMPKAPDFLVEKIGIGRFARPVFGESCDVLGQEGFRDPMGFFNAQ